MFCFECVSLSLSWIRPKRESFRFLLPIKVLSSGSSLVSWPVVGMQILVFPFLFLSLFHSLLCYLQLLSCDFYSLHWHANGRLSEIAGFLNGIFEAYLNALWYSWVFVDLALHGLVVGLYKAPARIWQEPWGRGSDWIAVVCLSLEKTAWERHCLRGSPPKLPELTFGFSFCLENIGWNMVSPLL